MTGRLDLPPAGDAEAVLQAFGPPLAGARREQPVAGGESPGPLLLHVFVHDAAPAVADAVVRAVRTLAATGGHGLHDLLLVDGDCYRPVVADGVVVLREDGAFVDRIPVPRPADVPGVAELVLRGRSVLAGRDEVVAGIRRHDMAAAADTQAELDVLAARGDDGAPDPLEALARLGRWVVHGQGEPDAAARASIVVALADRMLRDVVLARWLPELFSVEDVLTADLAHEVRRAVHPWPVGDQGALDRLLTLAAKVPRAVAAPLLTTAGTVAWGTGEGTVANEAIDLALQVEPDYRMALLVRTALERGMPPWRRSAQAA